MHRATAPLLVAVLGTVCMLALTVNVSARVEEDHSDLPKGAPQVHGSPTATCTPRTCRFRVTCNETTDPKWEGEPCSAAVGLGFRDGTLLTRPVFVQQNARGETPPYAPAKLVQLRQGETRTLGLRTVKDAGLRIKRALGKGKRTLRGGYWEAMRYQYPIRGSDGHIDGFALEVGPLEKIRIKRRFGR